MFGEKRSTGLVQILGQLDLVGLPAPLFAAEPADELVGAVELAQRLLHRRVELVAFGDRRVVLLLQRLQLGLDRAELVLLFLELRHHLGQLLLGLGQRGFFGRDVFGHAVVRFHRKDPHGERAPGLADLRHALRRELLVRGVLFDLLDDLLLDVVLVVVLQPLQELHVAEQLLGLVPGRLHAEEHAHGLHREGDHLGRVREGLDLGDRRLVERIQRFHGPVVGGKRLVQIRLHVVLLRFHGLGDLVRRGGFFRHDDLLFAGHLLVGRERHHEVGRVLLRLHELGLHDRELLLQAPHELLALAELFQAALVARKLGGHGPALGFHHAEVHLDQLEVRRGRRVVVPSIALAVVVGRVLDRPVHEGGHFAQVLDVVLDADVEHLAEEVPRDAVERVLGPLVEPVDRAAVDDAREHAAARAERGPDRRKGEHHVQVFAHELHKVGHDVVARQRAHAGLLRARTNGARDLLELVELEQVGHLAGVEEVVDVLHEGLHDDLRVHEEERHLLVVSARRVQHPFQVLAPLGHAVPGGEKEKRGVVLK